MHSANVAGPFALLLPPDFQVQNTYFRCSLIHSERVKTPSKTPINENILNASFIFSHNKYTGAEIM